MKALVTGGAGFIGSHLVEALLREGHQVRVLDNLSTGHRANLADVLTQTSPQETRNQEPGTRNPAPQSGAAAALLEDTITDLDACRNACADIDWVFHQAAIPSVPRSVAEPLPSHEANATGTLNMLLAARDAGVKRFVYAASSSAYGDTPTLPKQESMPPTPMSPYAAQKLLGETYCKQFHALYGLQTIALRYFNIFGPRQDPNSPYGGVIPKFVSALLANEPPKIFGDGEQTRDFTFIDNAVSANLLAAAAPASACGRTYNVACGARFSLNHLLATLQQILGTDLAPEHRDPRAGDVRDSLADIGLAVEHLGYEVKFGFEEGLRRTVEWYQRS